MGVRIFKLVRERLGWTHYRMAKTLGITQTQYNYLEREAKSSQTKVLIKLGDLWLDHLGLPIEKFWELLKREAEK